MTVLLNLNFDVICHCPTELYESLRDILERIILDTSRSKYYLNDNTPRKNSLRFLVLLVHIITDIQTAIVQSILAGLLSSSAFCLLLPSVIFDFRLDTNKVHSYISLLLLLLALTILLSFHSVLFKGLCHSFLLLYMALTWILLTWLSVDNVPAYALGVMV